jgi:epoxyqueuosine reductase
MAYLARSAARRSDVRHVVPTARSVIAVAVVYNTDRPYSTESRDPARAHIARYAWGDDYHEVIGSRLEALVAWMRACSPEPFDARAYVDTGPVLERVYARHAGIGWIGKNTCVISPSLGSWIFLGEVICSLDLHTDQPALDQCGTCTLCLEACPTHALVAPGVLDSNRCISYLTIEHRGAVDPTLAAAIGAHVYGCDICQEVCPWNGRKFVQVTREGDFAPRAAGQPPSGVQLEPGAASSHPGTAAPSLISLLETALDETAWDTFSRGSAIRRAGRAGFARNICVGLGNSASPDAVPVLANALSDPEPLVRAHAAWALGRVGSAEARSALSSRASTEPDASVLEELSKAMDA